MSAEGNFTYYAGGTRKTGVISLQDYQRAADQGVRVRDVINAKYSDADIDTHGSAWDQGKRSAGIFKTAMQEFGIPSTTIADALSGQCMNYQGLLGLTGNTISAPSGPVGGSTPSSRLFLPEVLMELAEENLQDDYTLEMAMFERLLAESVSIGGPVYTMPKINTEAPMAYDGRPQAQNALPNNLVSITASEVSQAISTQSVGLQISDQATQLSTLNLVSIIFAQQMLGSKLRKLWVDLARCVAGNPDAGEAAITPVAFTTYDATAAAGTITHSGWIKALYQPARRVSYNAMVCTIDDYLAIQNRTGRPLMFDPQTTGPNTGNAGTYGIDVTMAAPANFAQLNVPFVFIIPSGLWAAKQILLLDTRFALRRVINTLATYSASEQMVLQRSSFYRIDWGFIIHRIFEEAFLLVDYN